MAVNPDQIDLNSHGGSVDRGKEVNVSEPLGGETLTESVPSQAQIQEQIVDGFGKKRKMEGIDKVSGLGSDVGFVDKEAHDEFGVLSLGRCSSMEGGDGASMSGNGDGISEREERGKDAKIKTSGEVVDGISVNASPEGSSHHKDVDMSAGVDGEGSCYQLENQAMEVDSPAEKNRIQMAGSQSSGEVDALNGNVSTSVDLVVDHDMSTDGDLSCDVEASSVGPDASKSGFHISDLVWGKVRSYPWWPGQIFDPSDASAKAKKYFRKDAYLVAYFGDDTFAWNEVSQIKPFRPHFSRMEKQSNSADFRHAVSCALEEVSIRTELGLSCSCSSKFETQIIVNSGIKEEATQRISDDSFSSATLFKPLQLVEFVRALAPSPLYDRVDKLQIVTSQAQLLAFHHWKGYPELPQFEIMRGTLEDSVEIPPSEGGKQSKEIYGVSVPSFEADDKMPSGDFKPGSEEPSPCKQKNGTGDDISSSKKEKSLSELLAEARLRLRNGKKGPNSKPGIKSTRVSPGKKRKGIDSVYNDSMLKHKKSSLPTSADNPPQSKQGFRVGASILRVASQLNGASSILKNGDGMARKSAVKNKGKGRRKITV